ncbi:TFIIB-type zinc ribbon-containing protein [Methanobrevibacter filiformis]|uniref:DNA-directed RNA polymerase subunit P n=1 Tax=Methanobrevibacter filiformis TaxID=55758 RepID=A0A162FCK1_9EURY|nr:TFIIB-type zinc ribbon-containing protein [Methanobrevibacter filiformis]KZX11015.1 DNA-directed RNA polymerase subunit P [Methanobrevibacter filiformis]
MEEKNLGNLENQNNNKLDISNNQNQDNGEEDTSNNQNQDNGEEDTSNNQNQDNSEEDTSNNEPKIIQTNPDAKDGQNKCPKCGATDISLNANNGKLRCNFCRYEFEVEKVGTDSDSDLRNLKGEVIGSGAQNIIADVEDVLTFKCSSCGAEVIINTTETTQARCHWCRNTLSINQQIPNGAIPDMVLPFKLKKDDAKVEIETFVEKRKFFAHPKFKEEFSTQNVMGVYLPYMVVDINGHSKLSGQGEHTVRTYTVGSDKNKETLHDADLYNVEREFDVLIDDLTIESSSDKLMGMSSEKTNNIINSIMPFDTENSVKWNANYLKGYSSEKRDINIEQLKSIIISQIKDISRYKANTTLAHYDRGVKWSSEQLDIKGQKWIAAYLPVWLYSYQQVKSSKKSLLHYVAVNARTKEIMGSVPIHMPKLFATSAVVEVFGIIIAIFTAPITDDYSWIVTIAGFVFFAYFYFRYRNTNARHAHEKETKATVENLKRVDIFIRRKTGLKNSNMKGANNKKVSNKNFAIIDWLID